MPWSTEYNRERKTVEARYEGLLDAAELRAAAESTIDLVRRWGVDRLFSDCTALAGGHSALDLFGVLERLQSAEDLPRGWRQAILLPASSAAVRDVEFWETLCRNRGLNVRIFSDRDVAFAWLLGPPPSR